MKDALEKKQLFENIRELLISAKQNVLRQVNTAMVQTYFEIGRLIVEDEQKGEKRAEYGAETLKLLSTKLTQEFGKGFPVQNIERMRLFYLTYSKSSSVMRISSNPSIGQTMSAQSSENQKTKSLISQSIHPKFELSWTHYIVLMRQDQAQREFYEIESKQNNWSVRELERQCHSLLYERLIMSKDKEEIRELSTKGQIIEKPEDLIKDPYIFEFLGLRHDKSYSESEVEAKIIDSLEALLLELGKGFTFVARQQRISFDEEHFFIDLVFYNRLLKCFVIFDIKVGKLKHQDLGQLQMYVNYYDRMVKSEDENKTIGILLCAGKKDAVVEMTLPEDNKQLFASKYKLYLPTKEELIKQIKF